MSQQTPAPDSATPAVPADTDKLTQPEKRAIGTLASIFSLRMLGLFLVLPVFALYAQDLAGATPALIGFALGVYGLTQAVLQIPFGAASDKIGRKPVITVGLLLFAGGSFVCAAADTMTGMVIGRMLQGSGAVAAAITALMADVTREQVRTKAMAMLGGGIALSFAFAMVVAPIMAHAWGVDTIFTIVGVMALVSIAMLWLLVPTPTSHRHHRDMGLTRSDLKAILAHPDLRRLDISAFVLHMAMTAVFVAVPVLLVQHLPASSLWKVYLPVILISFVTMVPTTILAETRGKIREVLIAGVVVVGISFGLLYLGADSKWGVIIGLGVFFVGFNMLEPILPSLVTKFSPAGAKGTGSGVYNTFQFLGPAAGGTLGGILLGHGGPKLMFMCMGLVCMVWLVAAWGMRSPLPYRQVVLPLDRDADEDHIESVLMALDGVGEVRVFADEGEVHVRYIGKKVKIPEMMAAIA